MLPIEVAPLFVSSALAFAAVSGRRTSSRRDTLFLYTAAVCMAGVALLFALAI